MLEVLAPLEDWVSSHFGLPGWLVTPAVILALALIADLFARIVVWRGVNLLEKTHNRWDDTLLLAVRRPLWVGIWGTAIIGMASLLAERFGNQWAIEHVPTALWLFVLVMIGWSGARLTRLIEKRLVFPPAKHPGRPLDASTASAISKLLGATILILVVLSIFQALGMSISGLLAFGGAGGLIIGFAARNVLTNFFGGLAIHLDSPFKVGDWISSPDREIEGVVEDIGWRLAADAHSRLRLAPALRTQHDFRRDRRGQSVANAQSPYLRDAGATLSRYRPGGRCRFTSTPLSRATRVDRPGQPAVGQLP